MILIETLIVIALPFIVLAICWRALVRWTTRIALGEAARIRAAGARTAQAAPPPAGTRHSAATAAGAP